jgi:aryl-alcohol dehydrogenase-like predicted oxidoreductase
LEYVPLGRTGLSVSRLCLGTVNFGPVVEEPEAHSIMDASLDAGINFVDTANTYGYASGRGRTEQIIGNWFAKGGGRRQATVLGTKVFEGTGTGPNDGGLSALNLRRALDASLARLQTDYIDLYQFHHVDRTTPWDEIWQAIEVATSQGKIIYAGSSNFAAWHIAQAQGAATRRGLIGLVSEQSIYNLLTRDVEREVLPAVRTYGLGFLAWAPLHEGILGGRRAEEGDGKRRRVGRAADAASERAAQLAQFEDLADALGHRSGELALAWLLSQPGVTAPIIGPRHLQQLASAVRAASLTIDSTTLARLDEIFPGHQPAPEGYAW